MKYLERKRKNKNCIKSKFLGKLFTILNSGEYSNCIKWYDDTSFIITDKCAFEKSLLRNFNHSNFSSFIRQLNNYNFHKTSLNKGEIKYQHDEFNKNKSLDKILLIPKKHITKKKVNILLNIFQKVLENNRKKNEYFEKGELSEERNEIIILKNILEYLEKISDNQINIKEKLDTIVNQNKQIIEIFTNLEGNQNNLIFSKLRINSIVEDEISNLLNQSDDYSLFPYFSNK